MKPTRYSKPLVIGLLLGTMLVAFVAEHEAQAAGGGGGGSSGGSLCSADTWACTEWGQCSAQAKQTRTCTLNFDCPFTDTPKPAEEQACTPPCTEDTWTCTEWSECTPTRDQTRTCTLTTDCPLIETPKPAETQTCTPSEAVMQKARTDSGATSAPVQTPVAEKEVPKAALPAVKTPSTATAPKQQPATACKADTWECSAWSGCDRDGNQKRACNKTFDCAAADTEQPPLERRCQEVQCGNKATLRERVRCRLELSPNGLARDLELEYLPEECRFSPASSPARSECVELYKSYRPCWRLAVGPERSECARKIITLPENLPEQAAACRQRFALEACLNDLRQKAYNMIKFRFYDLEQRAENLIDYGADINLVSEFVATVYEKKDAFNRASSSVERRKIILEVRNAWQDFVRQVKGGVKNVDERQTSQRYRLFY